MKKMISGPELLDDLFSQIQVQRDSLLYDVTKGLKGENQGIPLHLEDLDETISGFQRGFYYLIGAESGAGKTTLADDILLDVYEQIKNKPHTILYYSFEISKMMKRAKIASYYVAKKHRVRINPKTILGLKHTLTREQALLVIDVAPQVDQFFKDITFVEETVNPTGIYKDIFAELEKVGDFQYEEYTVEGKVKHKIVGFEYTDKEHFFIVVIDHIGLCGSERGLSKKENIDKISEYLVYFRNRANISPIVVQQFNTDLTNSYRSQENENTIAPTRLDFGDSKYTYRDADVVFGLVDPITYAVRNIAGYNATNMHNKLRVNFLLKNRYGEDNRRWPLVIDPIGGKFTELPQSPTTQQIREINEQCASL